MLSPILTSKHLAHEPVFAYFMDKFESGRFGTNNPHMKTLMDYVVNRQLGVPVASSYSGIGEDLTNGFIQFIVDNPVQFHDLNIFLVELMDSFEQRERPCINIRSKTLPREFVTDDDKQYITVMFRSPKFRNRQHAKEWWETLGKHVQSYTTLH